jgi:adenylyl-sulfate kinase
MITDIVLSVFKKDPIFKRNILKTISWRVIGSIDTMLLGWFISGSFHIGAKIGLAELLTKMIIYYLHERIWQKTTFGLPSKKDLAKITKLENRPNLFKQTGKITRADREASNNNKAFTIWLTGLSGSGKSTLANNIEEWIFQKKGKVYVLDGDNTRLGINSDLSFTEDDRTENIRRVAEICHLFNDAGIIVIASFISPFLADRETAKKIINKDSFIEIYLDASLEVCQKRDAKGLYKLALEGKIKNFTGISSPYEPPVKPDIYLNTDQASVEDCMVTIKNHLTNKMYFQTYDDTVQLPIS